MSLDGPAHVYDPRPIRVAILLLSILVFTFSVILILQGAFTVPSGIGYYAGKGLILALILSTVGMAGSIRIVLTGQRLEFYGDFFRVAPGGGSPAKEIPYSRLEIGSLVHGRLAEYFVLSTRMDVMDMSNKTATYSVKNEEVEGTGSFLYDWISSRVSKE